MSKRPWLSIFFLVFTPAMNLFIRSLDASLFHESGSPLLWLSFNSTPSGTLWGISLLSSLFLHYDFTHGLINLLFLLPILMVLERRYSKANCLALILGIHFSVLLALMLLHFLLLPPHSYLGLSHVVIGLYTHQAIEQRKKTLFFLALMMVVSSALSTPLSLAPHLLGLMAGAGFSLIGRTQHSH